MLNRTRISNRMAIPFQWLAFPKKCTRIKGGESAQTTFTKGGDFHLVIDIVLYGYPFHLYLLLWYCDKPYHHHLRKHRTCRTEKQYRFGFWSGPSVQGHFLAYQALHRWLKEDMGSPGDPGGTDVEENEEDGRLWCSCPQISQVGSVLGWVPSTTLAHPWT